MAHGEGEQDDADRSRDHDSEWRAPAGLLGRPRWIEFSRR
jgi:hypothetical protein